LLNINTEKVIPYWIFDVLTLEQPAFSTSLICCNNLAGSSCVSMMNPVLLKTCSWPYLCVFVSIYCCLQNIWTPSKVIARLGKEINDESSYLYWAYKVMCFWHYLCIIVIFPELNLNVTLTNAVYLKNWPLYLNLCFFRIVHSWVDAYSIQ
jgi:hypothetical protein